MKGLVSTIDIRGQVGEKWQLKFWANQSLHLTQNPLVFFVGYTAIKVCGLFTVYLLGFWAGELNR